MSRQPGAVVRAFGVTREPKALEGGEGGSWRAGDLVFKAAPAVDEWSWLGEYLPTVVEQPWLALPLAGLLAAGCGIAEDRKSVV